MAMTPQEVYNLLYILFGVIGLQSIILILILWRTPSMIFLKAAMFKKPVMYIIGKDHIGYFKTFKPKAGAANIKGVGLFNLTENSHTLEGGSKIPIYFAFRDLAATLLPDYPAIIQEIRENGFLVNNLEDVKMYINSIKAGMTENFPIKVKPYKTYKFHDLANMFPFNIDPTFIDSTVQCEVSKFIKTMKMAPIAIGTVVVMIVVGALAIFIINKSYKGQITSEDCATMVEAAKCAGSMAQTALQSTPLSP
jgi:hypothetical protein